MTPTYQTGQDQHVHCYNVIAAPQTPTTVVVVMACSCGDVISKVIDIANEMRGPD